MWYKYQLYICLWKLFFPSLLFKFSPIPNLKVQNKNYKIINWIVLIWSRNWFYLINLYCICCRSKKVRKWHRGFIHGSKCHFYRPLHMDLSSYYLLASFAIQYTQCPFECIKKEEWICTWSIISDPYNHWCMNKHEPLYNPE